MSQHILLICVEYLQEMLAGWLHGETIDNESHVVLNATCCDTLLH